MQNRIFSFTFVFCALAYTASLSGAALDLTPHFITTFAEGARIDRPYFSDGEKKYAVGIDGETQLTASQGGALFTFVKFPSASMRLLPSPMTPQFAFDDTNLARYRDAAKQMLPPDAKEPRLDREEADVFPINRWQTYRATFAYLSIEGKMRESITFLNLNAREQIVVIVCAHEETFEKIAARSWDIIRRWHELREGDMRPN